MKTLSAYVSDSVRRLPLPHAAFGVTLVAYKTAADAASKTVTLVVTVAAARTLPAEDFGVMALAMTTGWLLGVTSDAGLPMFAATRVAQRHAAGHATSPVAREVMRWRSRSALVAAGVGLLVAALLVPPAAVVPFALIVAHQLLGAMLDTLAHVFRGLGRTDVESTISLAHRGAIALLALSVLAIAPSLLWLSVALAVPPACALAVAASAARRLTQGEAPYELTPRILARDVMPLGLGVLLSALYFRIDVYFLQYFHGVEAVGIYNAAFRIVDALRLFPAAGLAVAYPLLCAATDYGTLRRLSLVLVAGSLAVATAVYVSAPPLLSLVYGEPFAAAGAALRVLSFSIPLFFLNYALTHQLIGWDRQRCYLQVAAAALATNVAANLLLIPAGGMVGAAYSTLITELVVSAGCVLGLRRR